MRGRGYQPIDLSIRLQLEYEFLTTAELSAILTIYQRILRAAWRETLRDQQVRKSPAFRIVVTGASSSSPLEFWINYILPGVYFGSAIIGPLKDWPGFVRTTFDYLRAVWSAIPTRDPGGFSSDHVIITGGSNPQLNIPVSALHDSKTAQHIKDLWSIANKGRVRLTINIQNEDDSIGYRPE